jgi:hypothetical protein
MRWRCHNFNDGDVDELGKIFVFLAHADGWMRSSLILVIVNVQIFDIEISTSHHHLDETSTDHSLVFAAKFIKHPS